MPGHLEREQMLQKFSTLRELLHGAESNPVMDNYNTASERAAAIIHNLIHKVDA